jgi:hypothetical protein
MPTPANEIIDPLSPLPMEVAPPIIPAVGKPTSSTLQALKDELFELETDRIAGRVTAAEYAEHKAAFDVLLRRALSRIEPAPNTSNTV